jgi:uncharacterized membrane protein/dolichol kinase
VIHILAIIISDDVAEQSIIRLASNTSYRLLNELLLLLSIFNGVLWLAVWRGFFKINGRKSWGIAWFPFSLILLIMAIRFLCPDHLFGVALHLTAISFLILAFADGFAALIGYKYDPNKKTRMGSTVFFTIAFTILYFAIQSPIFTLPTDHSTNFFPSHFGWNAMFFLFSFFGALILTTAEYYSPNGLDNLTIPLVSMFYFLFFPKLPFWNSFEVNFTLSFGVFFATALALIWLVFKRKWLNESGIVMALIMAYVIVVSGLSLLPLLIFFILGTLSGKLPVNIAKNRSNRLIIQADKKHGKPRDAVQVLANGGLPLILAIILIVCYSTNNTEDFFRVQLISLNANIMDFSNRLNAVNWVVMSAALADTFSSELGMRFGKSPVDIFRFRKMEPGASGGITTIGTMFGVVGAMIMAICSTVFVSGDGILHSSSRLFWIVLAGGVVGTLLDSVLGSAFQRKSVSASGFYRDDTNSTNSFRYWSNDQVNFVSLLIIGLVSFIFV